MIAAGAGALARAVTARRYAAFRAALHDPEAAQARVRARIEAALPRSAYGRRHGPRLANLPIVRHHDLAPDIAAMQSHLPNVLWPGGVDHWMTTSGSSGAKKAIPITPALKAVFSDALGVWVHEVLTRLYRPRTGKLFMALAPPSDQALTHEAGFLGALAPLARRFLIAPRALEQTQDPAAFRALLAETLYAARELECVSLWSPTYLLAVMDLIERARGAQDWTALWPRLQFVSAWGGAAAARPFAELARRLPHAVFQAKGLIATETPATIPLHDAPAPVPLIDAVFYEFRSADGAILTLKDVREGEIYALILSTPGGFQRYAIGDLVRVGPRIGRTPTLDFIGRADAVSDLAGEKLSERAASEALAALDGRAAILAPRLSPAGYILFTENAGADDAARVEARLGGEHHYARARSLGQLAPVAHVAVEELRARLVAFAEARGQSMDSIKDCALIHDPAQAEALIAALTPEAPPPPVRASA